MLLQEMKHLVIPILGGIIAMAILFLSWLRKKSKGDFELIPKYDTTKPYYVALDPLNNNRCYGFRKFGSVYKLEKSECLWEWLAEGAEIKAVDHPTLLELLSTEQ